MSDYISKSALIENIKAEILCVEKEKQQYFEQGNFHNGNILVEKIQAMKLVMNIIANQPTVGEKEIIRKQFERVVERLEHQKKQYNRRSLECEKNGNRFGSEKMYSKACSYNHAIEIVKEEGGLNG